MIDMHPMAVTYVQAKSVCLCYVWHYLMLYSLRKAYR